MKIMWKFIRTIALSCIVLGLMFSSALFTVLLYAKIIGQDAFLVQNYEYAVVHAESLETNEKSALGTGQIVNETLHKKTAMLTAPLIMQYPELPRGCEITSLTMLLQFYGIDKGKMDLLSEMNIDSTGIQYNKDGTIKYWGHPNIGFVGDITLKSAGFGIYHAPLFDLLESYIPTAVDLSEDSSFTDLEVQISQGIPVMVWTTVTFAEPKSWVEWDTPIGSFKTTFQEHAVLLVGYDQEHVYVNDPLKNANNIKINKKQFIAAWEVMGKQALSYTHEKQGG